MQVSIGAIGNACISTVSRDWSDCYPVLLGEIWRCESNRCVCDDFDHRRYLLDGKDELIVWLSAIVDFDLLLRVDFANDICELVSLHRIQVFTIVQGD